MATVTIGGLATEFTAPADSDLLEIEVGGASGKIQLINLLRAGLGNIYVQAGAGSQATTSATAGSDIQINQFTANGITRGSCTPDHTNDVVTADDTGFYVASCQCTFTVPADTFIEIKMYWNGALIAGAEAHKHTGSTGTDEHSLSIPSVPFEATSASKDLAVYFNMDTVGNFVLLEGNLTLERRG